MARATASAPGKVIIVGEHFVVGGQPAIAAAINLRARATVETIDEPAIEVYSDRYGRHVFHGDEDHPLYPVYRAAKGVAEYIGVNKGLRVHVESSIPAAAGLGSSAAVAVSTTAATALALGHPLTLEEVSSLAYEAEKTVHGTPSGIDNTVATYGGVVFYRKNQGFEHLKADLTPVNLLLADSGIERRTGDAVAMVLRLRSRFGGLMGPLYEVAGLLAWEARKAIENNDFEALGALMNINHGLLSAVGVSNIPLETIVHTARGAGALGAKITGAGCGGLALVLCWARDAEGIKAKLSYVSARVYATSVSRDGVRLEEPR